MEILTRYREVLVEAMDSLVGGPPSPILAMCRYHLGLAEVDGTTTRASAGKMLRPALCLAMCEALGGDIHQCLPAALSLELTHRTSLIFDDIQDRSPQRNHRPTIWGVWGVDQAINAGLALSCYARLALHGMAERGVSPGTFHEIQRLLEHTVIDLTRGQYLDIHFQQAMSPVSIPTLGDYLEMVRLKTGVLLGTACEVGAMVAGAQDRYETARRFGESLGTAFQLQDDILGTWGDPEVTGKSSSDLSEGKTSLPIVLAMKQGQEELWPLLQVSRAGPDGVERLRDKLTSWDIRSRAEALIEQHRWQRVSLRGLVWMRPGRERSRSCSAFLSPAPCEPNCKKVSAFKTYSDGWSPLDTLVTCCSILL